MYGMRCPERILRLVPVRRVWFYSCAACQPSPKESRLEPLPPLRHLAISYQHHNAPTTSHSRRPHYTTASCLQGGAAANAILVMDGTPDNRGESMLAISTLYDGVTLYNVDQNMTLLGTLPVRGRGGKRGEVRRGRVMAPQGGGNGEAGDVWDELLGRRVLGGRWVRGLRGWRTGCALEA